MAGQRQARTEFIAVRKAAGYTQEALAEALHVDRTTVARWETGARTPLAYIRPRLARLLGCGRDELRTMLDGELVAELPARTSAPAGPELADVLAMGTRAGTWVLDALRLHLEAMRGMDRSMGATAVRAELWAKLRQVDDMAHAAPTRTERRALLRLLVELHTLAGWTAHDQADTVSAWREHNRARTVATAAGATAHVAHAQAQQAVILAEAGHVERARAQAADAIDVGRAASRALRSWLAASHGEVLAYAGEQDAALHAFDRAARWVGGETSEHEPYVGLDAAHLARWRGQVLVRLAHPEALAAVMTALSIHDPTYRRAEASLRIDLAQGLARTDRAAASEEVARARAMVAEVKSPRLEARARSVSLPL